MATKEKLQAAAEKEARQWLADHPDYHGAYMDEIIDAIVATSPESVCGMVLTAIYEEIQRVRAIYDNEDDEQDFFDRETEWPVEDFEL